MNLSQLDLSNLLILKHLLEKKHVSNTALTLNISQPTVSRALQKGRDLFKDELLVRTTHGYELTPKGELIRQDIGSILAMLDNLVDGSEFNPSESRKTIKFFGLVPQVNWLLPPVFKHLREHAPNMVLDIDTVPQKHFDKLIAGEVHFSISSQTPPAADQNLYRMLIATRDFRLLMNKDHPLAQQPLTPDNLKDCHFGQISLHGDRALSIQSRFNDIGLSTNDRPLSTPLRLSNFNAAPKMAEMSDVIFHLPTPFAEDAARSHNVVTREVPEELRSPYSDIYLYWHKRYHNDPMCQWVREIFKTLYPK
ncbi:LysR family transcriptional regulator [Vibrio sp. CyArs1]|uniref:LysR family transcriptional regulator n=1 Tax=Vibrio sp. CyArs1 TaxID=2682577 RepID=UPI001F05AF66|nr:LysR family transcriptional regulator [Vibrio sp. CyArs1]